MKNNIRIIGDTHGRIESYRNIIKDIDHSIQLGDFGFEEWNQLSDINSDNHKILAGNHDDYSICKYSQLYLGDYGNMNFHGMEFFFIRGAFSIDKAHRTENISWWKDEELEYTEMMKAMNEYENTKPDMVLTHDCPDEVNELVFGITTKMNNPTSMLFKHLFELHQPKLWMFGHWHETLYKDIKGTTFVCLDELDYIDYDVTKDVDANIESIKKQVGIINTKKYLPPIY